MMNLSKFTFNKKILSGIVTFFLKKNLKTSGIVTLSYNQVCCQIFLI